MYSRELIDDILSKSDIVDVISSYISVQKKGRSYLAVCPFHNDKNPSLNISREKQIYKCFSCGAGGNAITFIRDYEKVSFQEAVRKLADIIGYNDPRLTSEAYERKIDPNIKPLYDCINDLCDYYIYCLGIEEGETARKYLLQRNIGQDEVQKFKIGYAPLDGAKTIKYLQAKGHSLKSIEEIGIALARATGTKDSNKGRLIFPLLNKVGQVVGFSARRLNDNEDSPKYINSPETKIFHKSEVMYNYSLAKKTARRDGYIYVLEGFMDVISLNKAGINSAVALMGTNLSNEHLLDLKKLNVEIRLSLDGDYAGQKGMMNMIKRLYASNVSFRIVDNKGDQRDPDDIFKEEGKEALVNRMNNLVDPFDFQLNYYERVYPLQTKEDQRKAFHYFIPYLSNIEPGIDRDNYIVKLSRITGYEPRIVSREINKVNSKQADSVQDDIVLQESTAIKEFNLENKYIKRLALAEKETIYYMLQNEEAIKYFEQNIDSFYIDIYQDIANYILDYYASRKSPIEIDLLLSDIERSERPNNKDIMSNILEILNSDSYPPYSIEEIENCAEAIQEEKRDLYVKTKMENELQGKTEMEKLRLINEYSKLKKDKLRKNNK